MINNINNINMDKYKIGEVVHLKVEKEIENKIEKGVIVFEYLGRGLNAIRKLSIDEKFVCIEEGGDDIKLTSLYSYDLDEIKQRNEVNEYRAMMGRFIYSYGISDENLNKFVEFLDDEYEKYFIEMWTEEAKIPKRDQKIIKKTKDENVILMLMEKYKKIPLTKEEEIKMRKSLIDSTLNHGVITGANGEDIPVMYFGDGTDKTKVHTYHIEGTRCILHPNSDIQWIEDEE